MSKPVETIALPAEGFALLIKAAATSIINNLALSTAEVNITFLHQQVGLLDELVSKLEILHNKRAEAAHASALAPHVKK